MAFKVNELKKDAKIVNVLSRSKSFIVFFEGETAPVILAKVIAAEDGYVHRTQLMGLTVNVTPTQASNGTQPGFLGTIELPMANVSGNQLLAHRQNRANDYALAQLYSRDVVEA